MIPLWYCALVERARLYIEGGGVLEILETPTGAYTWLDQALIERGMQNLTDAQGLDYAGFEADNNDDDDAD
jgi:hypothetical protein